MPKINQAKCQRVKLRGGGKENKQVKYERGGLLGNRILGLWYQHVCLPRAWGGSIVPLWEKNWGLGMLRETLGTGKNIRDRYKYSVSVGSSLYNMG